MSLSPPSASIRVGTASWSEPEFVKAGWYPKGLPAEQRLSFYVQSIDYVELNSSTKTRRAFIRPASPVTKVIGIWKAS